MDKSKKAISDDLIDSIYIKIHQCNLRIQNMDLTAKVFLSRTRTYRWWAALLKIDCFDQFWGMAAQKYIAVLLATNS